MRIKRIFSNKVEQNNFHPEKYMQKFTSKCIESLAIIENEEIYVSNK